MTLQAFLEGAARRGATISTRRLSEEGARGTPLSEMHGETALFCLTNTRADELACEVEYTEMTEMYRSRNAIGHIAASEELDRYWFWLEQR